MFLLGYHLGQHQKEVVLGVSLALSATVIPLSVGESMLGFQPVLVCIPIMPLGLERRPDGGGWDLLGQL